MPATPERPVPLTILAFDYGQRRIGVAVGQQVTGSASPVGAAANGEAGPDWDRIDGWIREWRPGRLVVGMPRHADGSPSGITAAATAFARQLADRGLTVDTVDERYTSIEATERLRQARADGRRGRIRKETIDAAAAVLIAERWLAEN